MKTVSPWFKIAFLTGVLLCGTKVYSQTMPAFSIIQSNGKTLKTSKLPGTRPVILVYFSPDCDHCITLLDEMFSRIEEFKRATILLVSFRPMNEISAFEKKYKTGQHKNIIVGIEQPVFFLRNQYQLQSTPFTALFNKKGNLVYSYGKETPVNDLLIRLKKIM